MSIQETLRAAMARHAAGEWRQAEAGYRQVLAAQPQNADALHLLGRLFLDSGHLVAAQEQIERAIAIRPREAEFRNSLGSALAAQGKYNEAIDAFRKAIQRKPDFAEAHCNLGDALQGSGKFKEAIASYRRAIAFKPALAIAHAHLGNAYVAMESADEAIAAYRQALERDEGLIDARLNLAALLHAHRKPDEAFDCYEQLIALAPGDAEAHNNFANLLSDMGDSRKADAHYRRALEIDPQFASARSNFLLNLSYLDDLGPTEILGEHKRFDELHARPVASSVVLHGNSRDPDRRLRIGYVSPDFREHAVANFFEPVLASHSRDDVEVFCYSLHPKNDAMTVRLKGLAGQWRDLFELTDAEAAERIRSDGIDVLVDLAGHTAGNRILIFARKPAPVQMTWLGYPCTTGLSAIDYRITDGRYDPPDATTAQYSEKLLRMPGSQWCYRPREDFHAVGPLPASKQGHVTFGSFNNAAKVSDATVALWARILRAVPDAHLLVKQVPEGRARGWLEDRFARHGVDPERLTLVGRVALEEHLASFNSVDVALDTFPYHGTTTTCDTLWMGLPTVTLSGEASAARAGPSLLATVGLPQLIAKTPEEYVEIATNLARDLDALAQMRRDLRSRMAASSLMDPPSFTRALEALMRDAWRGWCSAAGRIGQQS